MYILKFTYINSFFFVTDNSNSCELQLENLCSRFLVPIACFVDVLKCSLAPINVLFSYKKAL